MKTSFLFCCFFMPFFGHAEGDIYIKLGEARAKKSLLALPPIQYLGGSVSAKAQTLGSELFNIINNDLAVSSYFKPIPQSAFLEDTKKTKPVPKTEDPAGFDFASWKPLEVDFLIRGQFLLSGPNIEFEAWLYHVPQSKKVFSRTYRGPESALRRIAHSFTNDVLKELTGQTGMFLSKFVVSSDRESGLSKEIFILDWDGSNVNKLTNLKSLAISPAWSADQKSIAYTAYVKRKGKRNADLFLQDLKTGKRKPLSFREGINSGAAFSPDGNFIFLTLARRATADIYKLNLKGDVISQLTKGPLGAMNVEPAVSSDGRKIAFSSDRSGATMIHTMNVDGSNVKRVTLVGQFNASPSWSPDGLKIAFAGQTGDNFDVFVMNADGTGLVRLTSAIRPDGKPANNEDPSFSPDGRFVAFTSDRTGKNQIFISTVDGSEERQVTQDQFNYFKPKWSKNFE